MKSRKWIVLTGLVVALVAVLAIVPAVWAQGPGGGRGPGNTMLATVAETLGIDQADLVTELQSGKTIADLAEEKGVTVETLVNTVLAEREVWLAERVASGQMTQVQADFMLANMSAHMTEHLSEAWAPGGYGPGYGMGHGLGYRMGFANEDGDGVCNYCGTGTPQMFQGGGRWGR